jgi:BirA family biotin operon repressor/biotin-[acetyl-CoA-carboxylase] ligase
MSGFEKKQIILNALADGQFHSGETLGQLLGISRAAVGKHIKQLGDLGIEVFSVSGKGYRLSDELVLLANEKIGSHYKKLTDREPMIEVKHVIDSTNDYLLQKVRSEAVLNSGDSVVAECQTAGRGRRGRAWVSPFGSHIYLSMYWQLEGIQQAMGLSIAVGLAVREAIQSMVSSNVQVKWPNDLLVERQKIAGILVELEGQTDGPCGVVIGVGVNVNMPEQQGELIDQPWTDITTHSNHPIDRNELVASLIYHMKTQLNDFELQGLEQCVARWNQFDRYYNQAIELIMGSRRLSGIGKGIDSQGGILILETGASKEKAYYGGEISLRSGS